jgi:hypothetical protein
MVSKRNNSQDPVFFQIHRDGSAVDGVSYATLEEATAALEKAARGGEVAAVDALDQIMRRYSAGECRSALNFTTKA